MRAPTKIGARSILKLGGANGITKSMEKTTVHYIETTSIFWDDRTNEIVPSDKISRITGAMEDGYKPTHHASMTLHLPFSQVMKNNEGKRIFLYSTFWKEPNWNTRVIILDK